MYPTTAREWYRFACRSCRLAPPLVWGHVAFGAPIDYWIPPMSDAMFDLAQRVAIVVGGTSGVGRAIALGLARAGADVVATSRSVDAIRPVAGEIEAQGRRTLVATSDVSDRESLIALERRVSGELGPVDILVNCAGKTVRTASLSMSEEQWEDILGTNLTGTFRACQVFGREMVERRRGSIINIASLASFVGFMEVAAYTASKSGVAGLTRALAVEWAPLGVRVNAIAPGLIPTPLNERLLVGTPRGEELIVRTPMHRFGQAEEVVGAAVYLASEASRFVTGEIMAVDGGFLASGVNQ